MKRILAAALFALCLFEVTACDRGADAERRSTPPAEHRQSIPIQTAVVKTETVAITVTGYGSVQGGANAKASLAFVGPGRIAHVYVAVGDRVRAGEVLAQLDSIPFRSQERQAGAQLASARANYDKAIAQTQGSSTQLGVAQAQLRRQQELFKLGISSQSDVDVAAAAVASARAQLGVSGQNPRIRPDIEIAQASIEQAQAALAAAQQNVAYASLIAPFSGIVTARLHNDGETVDQTSPVIEIAKDNDVVFTAQFTAQDASRTHVGDHAMVQAQSGGEQAGGSVIAINPNQTNDARSVDVLIRLTGGGLAFGPGAYGAASIRVGSAHGLVVPTSAIVSDPTSGSSQVFKRQGDQYLPIPVDIEETFGRSTWVESDELHAGDVVAARGALQLLAPARAPTETDVR